MYNHLSGSGLFHQELGKIKKVIPVGFCQTFGDQLQKSDVDCSCVDGLLCAPIYPITKLYEISDLYGARSKDLLILEEEMKV